MTAEPHITNAHLIAVNKSAHDSLAADYDELHVEIFNPTEQARIIRSIKRSFEAIRTDGQKKYILDFGAGTGNLTTHLSCLGATVVAADVSQESLNRLKMKFADTAPVSTVVLNGKDLNEFADSSFDMVAAYSVLHHIPDYAACVEEFVRIIKPGGVIYLDHEVCPSYWNENETYRSYLAELGQNFLDTYLYEVGTTKPPSCPGVTSWVRGLLYPFLRKRIRTGIAASGDIHVYKYDHIEWEKIITCLGTSCGLVEQEEYLVCRERSDQPVVWRKWREKCVDMRLLIARKTQA